MERFQDFITKPWKLDTKVRYPRYMQDTRWGSVDMCHTPEGWMFRICYYGAVVYGAWYTTSGDAMEALTNELTRRRMYL